MNAERNHTIAKTMMIIPIVLLAVTLLSLAIATALEGPTGRGTVYSIFMIIVLIGLFLAPPACFIFSIIAIVFSGKAMKEGNSKSVKILIIGIIELVFSVGGVILAILMFIGGQSV
ncbi:MAG: hypothetical protein K6E63_04185 [Lachnospiraceae bacterium]|nr:hypothetical protein [Lachnospiraceae bacterium]